MDSVRLLFCHLVASEKVERQYILIFSVDLDVRIQLLDKQKVLMTKL